MASFRLGGLLQGLGGGIQAQEKHNIEVEQKRKAALERAQALEFRQTQFNEVVRHNKAMEAQNGGNTSEIASFKYFSNGLSEEDALKARRIELGLDPRATGNAAMTIANTGSTGQVAESESRIAAAKAGATETAKLESQLELKPQVEAAVSEAVEGAKAKADVAAKNRSNKSALDVYETAMRGLSTALGNTYTGPINKIMPAMTANAQIAVGASAAMAPVLKQLFRTAGEGTFTDKDQELLMNMLPGREDHPEAIAAKLQNIDSIVQMKLGQTSVDAAPTAQPSQYQEGQIATHPTTGETLIYRGGKWHKQ